MGEKVMIDDGLESLLTGQQFRRFQERVYAPVTETYGLSLLDIRVLLYLSEHRKYNTAKDIVQRHHWTKSHVSKSIEELIEKGLILRVPDDTDHAKYVCWYVRKQIRFLQRYGHCILPCTRYCFAAWKRRNWQLLSV